LESSLLQEQPAQWIVFCNAAMDIQGIDQFDEGDAHGAAAYPAPPRILHEHSSTGAPLAHPGCTPEIHSPAP
jgi:hypothetical protein